MLATDEALVATATALAAGATPPQTVLADCCSRLGAEEGGATFVRCHRSGGVPRTTRLSGAFLPGCG